MVLIPLLTFQLPHNATVPKSAAFDIDRSTRAIRAEHGLPDLRQVKLAEGDAELRLWAYRGTIKGLVIRCQSGRWTATRIAGDRPGVRSSNPPSPAPIRYDKPVSGWREFWKQAGEQGVWDLPDESALPPIEKPVRVVDSYSVDVETQRSGVYRAYHYTNPASKLEWRQAAHLVAFERLVDREFPEIRS